MKYFLLSNSVVITIADKTYTVSVDDYRFDKIKSCIELGDLDSVQEIVEPNNHLNKKGLAVEDGLVMFKGEAIPSVLGDKFKNCEQDSFDFKSSFNFWFNMKTRVNEEIASELINELISKKAYALTEDGFYFVYDDPKVDQTQNKLNKKQNPSRELFHFYNFSNCPTNYHELFSSRKNIDNVIEEVFGFNTKKLKSFVLDNIFKQKDNFINYKFLFYGQAFKDVLNNDNLFYAIENELLDVTVGDVDSYSSLNTFLLEYSKEKSGKPNQQKVLNLIKSCKDHMQLSEIGNFYAAVKNAFEIDMRNVGLSNNCEEIYKYLKTEYDKINDPLFVLNNDPIIERLEDKEIAKHFRIMIPTTNYDLKEWSNILQNCIHSYAQQIKEKKCQVIAIMDQKTNEMLYHVEIRRKQIQQFRGRGNEEPSGNDERIVSDFLKKEGIIYNE